MNEVTTGQDFYRRLAWRVMPLLVILFVSAFVARQNIAFAKLQMASRLNMSESTIGLGSSLFFIGYVLCEIPMSFVIQKFGARISLAWLVLIWGVLTAGMALATTSLVFYALRLALGVAQAGFYPGIIYCISVWFPAPYRARMLSVFAVGSSLGNTLSALVNGSLLALDGILGLDGWRWVFLGGSLPFLLLAFLTWRTLPSTVDVQASPAPSQASSWRVIVDWRVLALSVVYALLATAFYVAGYWLPTVIARFGVTPAVNGLLNAIPWVVSALVLAALPARLSAPRVLLPAACTIATLGAIAFVVATGVESNLIRFAAFIVGVPCVAVLTPLFWSFSSRFILLGPTAACIATINSLGNLGGFVAQNLAPWVDRHAPGDAMLIPTFCLTTVVLIALAAVRSRPGRIAEGVLQG